MTRDEVLELIRAHLADELQIDPARVTEETHFKRDLDADSLELLHEPAASHGSRREVTEDSRPPVVALC